MSGRVARLVAACCEVAGNCGDEVSCSGVHWVGGSGPGRKRIRLNRKTSAHLAGFVTHYRPRVWKRLCHVDFSGLSMPDSKRRRCDQAYEEPTPAQDKTGVG